MDTPTKPSFWKLALELRAGLEWGAHVLFLPSLKRWPKVAHGIPVLVLPGLATNDLAMGPMRHALNTLGYCAYGWEMGFNTGPTSRQLAMLARRVRTLSRQHGQSVALVGWSLGGAMAKAIAARCPRHVRCVVAMGSPLAPSVSTRLGGVFSALSGMQPQDPQLQRWTREPMPGVPMTSIASVEDGLLSSQSSFIPPGPHRETIFVRGVSHLGLPANPFVLWLVHDRLRQGKQWKKYSPHHAWEHALLVQ